MLFTAKDYDVDYFDDFKEFCLKNYTGFKHVNFLKKQYADHIERQGGSRDLQKKIMRTSKDALWVTFKENGFRVSDCSCAGRVHLNE